MAKMSKSKKPTNLGKGKVTPIQIAYIVDRFLADNNYVNTLAAFRSEAADLFSRTKGKVVPKGLLGLADILDDYVGLKEQRMIVDQEKRRVRIAFQGLQDVMRAYNAPGSPSSNLEMGVDPSNDINGSPPQGYGSLVNHPQQPMLPNKANEINKFSTPSANCSLSGKRKVPNSAPRVPPTSKKRCTGSVKDSQQDGIMSSGRVPSANSAQVSVRTTSAVKPASTNSITQSSVQSSSTAKSLFRNSPVAQANSSSSPRTPPQALSCQTDSSVSPIENSKLNPSVPTSFPKVVPPCCTIFSAETIVISPLKHKGYYASERGYCVSGSPLKSSSEKFNKREHVKGRLDFDESCVPQSSEELVSNESSPSTTDGEAAGNFDFDLPDFDIFDGDFCKFLGDIDLDCGQFHSSQQPYAPAPAHFVPDPSLEQNVVDGCVETNQASHNSCSSMLAETISKEMNFQGAETMTTMRSITKRITITSPSKSRSSCLLKHVDSPAKL